MSKDSLREAIRETLAMRLCVSADLNMQLAAKLIGQDQDELRKHFLGTAELMLDAAKALSAGPEA